VNSRERNPGSSPSGRRDERAILEERLRNKYRLEEEIGRGGFGIVFRGTDLLLERPVAIKTLFLSLMNNDELVRRFMQEAKIAAGLQHQNIVTIYQVGQSDEIRFFIMEYVEGITIKEYLKEHKVFPPALAVKIAKGICRALHYAHAKAVVHRDIKPENIIIDRKDRPVVTDFGIAKPATGQDLTRTNISLGTPLYMSPEQIRGDRVDHRSDQYSFGVLFYRMLAGRLPFQSHDLQALTYMHLHEDPPPIRKFNPNVSEELEAIVMRALKKYSHERYPDIFELLKDLERVDVYAMSEDSQVLLLSHEEAEEPAQNISEIFRRGMEAFKAKDYAEAVALLEEVLALNPDHDDALYYVDQAKMKQRSLERVSRYFEEGLGLYKQGKYSDAIRAWSRILAVDPSNKQALEHINMAKSAKQKAQRVEKLYRQADEAFRGREYQRALELFSKVLAIDESYRDAEKRIKQVRAAIRNIERAGEVLEEVRRLVVMRRFREAAEKLSWVLEVDPSSRAARELQERIQSELSRLESIPNLLLMARQSAEAGDYENAVRAAREVLAIDEDNADAVVLLTECEAALERRGQVLRLVSEAVRLEELEKFEEALDVLDQALRLEPEDEDARLVSRRIREELSRRKRCAELVARAREQLAAGQLLEAARALDEALDLDADHAEALALQAEVDRERQIQQARQEQFEQAIDAFHEGALHNARRILQELLDIAPDYPDGQVWMARIQIEIDCQERIAKLLDRAKRAFSQGDLSAASTHCNEILRFQANNREALDLLDQIDREQLRLARQAALFKRARAALEERHFNEAESALQQILEEQPGLEEAEELLAEVRRRREEFEQQLREVRLAIMLDEALDLLDNDKFEQADERLAEILAEDPTHEGALAARERLEAERSEYERRRREALVAEQLAQAETALVELDFDDALEAVGVALREDPENEEALKMQALIIERKEAYLEEQRRQRVADSLEKGRRALKERHLEEAEYALGQVLLDEPEHAEALESLDRITRIRTELARLEEAAEEQLAKAQFNEAIRLWERVLEQDPRSRSARRGLKQARSEQTRVHELTRGVKRAVAERNLDAVEETLRGILADYPAYHEAQLLMKEIKLMRSRHEELHKRARAHMEAKEFNQAIELWQSILAEDAHHEGAARGLAEAEERRGIQVAVSSAIDRAHRAMERDAWDQARAAVQEVMVHRELHPEVVETMKLIDRRESRRRQEIKADRRLARARQLIQANKLRRARRELARARKLAPGYAPIEEAERLLEQARAGGLKGAPKAAGEAEAKAGVGAGAKGAEPQLESDIDAAVDAALAFEETTLTPQQAEPVGDRTDLVTPSDGTAVQQAPPARPHPVPPAGATRPAAPRPRRRRSGRRTLILAAVIAVLLVGAAVAGRELLRSYRASVREVEFARATSNRISALLDAAEPSMSAGQYSEATLQLGRALRLDPGNRQIREKFLASIAGLKQQYGPPREPPPEQP